MDNQYDRHNLGRFTLLLVCLCMAVMAQSCPDSAEGAVNPGCMEGSLAGNWKAIGGVLIPPHSVDDYQNQAKLVKVPGYWKPSELGIEGNAGLVTLWVDLDWGTKLIAAQGLGISSMAILPGSIQSASRVYVDNGRGEIHKVFDNLSAFIPEVDEVSRLKPSTWVSGTMHHDAAFQLPKLYANSRVIIQMYNEEFRTGGVSRAARIALVDDLHHQSLIRWVFHSVFLGASLIMVAYCFSLAYFSKDRRPFYVFLVVMSLGAGARLLITSGLVEQLFYSLTVDEHFYLIWMSLLLLLSIFVTFQLFILPNYFPKNSWQRRFFVTLGVIPLLCIFSAVFLPLHQFILLGHGVRALYAMAGVVYTLTLAYHLLIRNRKLWFELIGISAIVIGAGADAYIYSFNYTPYVENFAFALFLFIVALATRLGWRYIKLLLSEKVLSADLKELNESLEEQVRERTSALNVANDQLKKAATTDALTDIPNRRGFDLEILARIDEAKNNNKHMCLAIADVDWFKSVNDSYGHDFGDTVLCDLAKGLHDFIPASGFVGRIGGEEFAIILSDSNAYNMESILNKVRCQIAEIQFSSVPQYSISISFGCTQYRVGDNANMLYRRADKALYHAKENGRGRVCIQDENSSEFDADAAG